MEARILLVSLLPSLALAFALAVGAGSAPTAQAVDRVGTTEVSSAEAEASQERPATPRTEGVTARR